MKKYFYKLLYKYISLYVFPENTLVDVEPQNRIIPEKFPKTSVLVSDNSGFEGLKTIGTYGEIKDISPEYILLNGLLHYIPDIQDVLEHVRENCDSGTRLITVYYNYLWNPLFKLASFMGLRKRLPEKNWISDGDLDNFLLLSGFETLRTDNRMLMPFNIPLISWILNKYVSQLPFFRKLNLLKISIARPVGEKVFASDKPSVSVVVPARNEAGNIEEIIKRVPKMGDNDELIFVEGNSTDGTWDKIRELAEKYTDEKNIVIMRQDGKGKGDAVRKAFGAASGDILMILDADMTVPPEDLPRFYDAIVSGRGEFINGSRLVYSMEKCAMRLFNLMGNKFFAVAFSYLLGQRFKDTLCGTKVISRRNYEKLAAGRQYFGDFDPFGDFDLIFGAARLGLKIVELPVHYKGRTYGDTNISRWSHGAMLFKMLLFAAAKIKFI